MNDDTRRTHGEAAYDALGEATELVHYAAEPSQQQEPFLRGIHAARDALLSLYCVPHTHN